MNGLISSSNRPTPAALACVHPPPGTRAPIAGPPRPRRRRMDELSPTIQNHAASTNPPVHPLADPGAPFLIPVEPLRSGPAIAEAKGVDVRSFLLVDAWSRTGHHYLLPAGRCYTWEFT
ncbi:hypothetical protein [Actinomadura sp. 9N407]|uniref:hypothetical protein n=1 Tax=Actinomadura sp. 9N407 TaxID=3375154 RepID=UPI0037AF7747